MSYEVGDSVLDFCLPNKDEIEICLRDFTGKWLVVYFYPKDNTPGCTNEAIDFTKELEVFEKLDAVIIGISPDSPKKHSNFIEKYDLKIILLSDEDKEICTKFGVWQKKKMYGKEYFGVVRSTFLINPDGKIAKIWQKVKVKNHANDVKNALMEIKSWKKFT